MKKFDIADSLILIGSVAILVGVGLIYYQAALILGGAGILYLGLRMQNESV